MIEFHVRHNGEVYIVTTINNKKQEGIRTFEDPLLMTDYFERYLIANKEN